METSAVVYEFQCDFQTSAHSLVENSFSGFASEVTISSFVPSASFPNNAVLKMDFYRVGYYQFPFHGCGKNTYFL